MFEPNKKRLTQQNKSYAPIIWLSISIVGLVTLSFHFVAWKHVESRYANRNIIQEIGFTGYLANEARLTLVNWYEESTLALQDNSQYRTFLRGVHEANGNPTPNTSSPRKKNLIYLQMESVDAISVEATFEGQPVMPFLNDLRKRSVYLANTLDNTSSGRTTDGEFLVLTSLPPITRKPVYRNYDLSKVPSLPRVLNESGYYTFSIHGYKGSFWNRKNAHAQLGYQDSFFIDSLNRSDVLGWGISDKSILKQAAEKIINSEKPIFAHIILLTNHHPYQYVSKSLGLPIGDVIEDHMVSLLYVDRAIESFFQELEDHGLLDDSLVAVYSDHDSSLSKSLKKIVHIDRTIADGDSVPLLIHGLDRPPAFIEKITGLQDLPVIALKELGIRSPHSFSGNSIESTQPTLSQFGQFVSLVKNKAIRTKGSIDSSTLSKLAILNPEQLEQTNDSNN